MSQPWENKISFAIKSKNGAALQTFVIANITQQCVVTHKKIVI